MRAEQSLSAHMTFGVMSPASAPAAEKERGEEHEKKLVNSKASSRPALKAEKENKLRFRRQLRRRRGRRRRSRNIANRLQLATLQAREKELEDLGAELAEMRATLAKVDGDGSALSLSCTILAKEIDYSERSLRSGLRSASCKMRSKPGACSCVRFKAHKRAWTDCANAFRRRWIRRR